MLPDRTGTKQPPGRRWVARGLVIGFVALVLLSVFPAVSLQDRVDRGWTLLAAAQASLLHGDVDAATGAFARARAEFEAAAGQSGNALLRAEGLVPFLGRTPATLLALAEVGRDVSDAGLEISKGLGALPLGLSSIGLSDGRIPIEALRSLGPAVHHARALLDDADVVANRLPGSWVLGPVGRARDMVREQLGKALSLVRAADALLGEVPSLAGAEGPKRYVVAAPNTADLRGTGGLIRQYAMLTIEGGRLSLGPFQTGGSADGRVWPNINMTPDAPTAAGSIEDLYKKVTGRRLDGVIFFELGALADLLDATGPVRVDALGHTVTAGNVVGYVATAGYLDSHLADPYRDGPRLVAESVWHKFLTITEPQAALRALVQAAAEGHLILHSSDPSVQAALRLAGVAGES